MWEEVPDPFVQSPTDAVIRVTTTNICGSDLHLYAPWRRAFHRRR
jgi:threonine dehydrogenase-like Zn-dependent dehydrogenase